MDENRFKEMIRYAVDTSEIDKLCLAWLRAAAVEQETKVRDMMLAAAEVIRRGME